MKEDESNLVGKFKTIQVKEENEKVLTYRCAISNKEEADEWLQDYSKITRTQWIVSYTYPNAQRVAYHKKYICAFSKKNKIQPEGISKRNQSCEVSLNVKIKLLTRDSKKKDCYLKESVPLCGIITISGDHSHNKACTILQYLRPGMDIREMFMEYFHDMSPSVALRVYQDKLRCQDDYEKIIADGHVMPLETTIYYWHKLWRTLNFGPMNDPLKTLLEKVDLYREQTGSTVVVRTEQPWAVLIATPVMKRAQSSFFCKSIVFCDTSASCDSTSANVTLMLTATKAGAVPICVLIHEAQTEDSYTTAFALFKETFPNGFGGQDHPHAFMTDNSTAEKNALAVIWSEAIQLLCGFHVGQAEWRWLESNASSDIRQSLMRAFQEIQYAQSTELLEEAIESLKNLNPQYYEVRIEKALDRKEEWVQLFRDNLPIGGHHTNNYAEATVRILKDVILQRTKAYNVVALADYIVNGWENYLQNKLSKYAYKRVANPLLLYNDLVTRMPAALGDKIIKIDEDTYHVPSAVTGEATYEVIVSAGSCMCRAGVAGAFCKHQALVHQKFGKLFPNQPLICSADRYLMGKLAFGDRCPEKEFFLDPKESLQNLEKDLQELQRIYSENSNQTATAEDIMEVAESAEVPTSELHSHQNGEEGDSEDAEEIIDTFTSNWKRISQYGLETNAKGFLKFMKRANRSLSMITNNNLAFTAIMSTSAALKGRAARANENIRVQSTSIGRRRTGLTRGSKRAAPGRPKAGPKATKPGPKVTKGNSRVGKGRPQDALRKIGYKPKRIHLLRANVEANRHHV